MSEQVQLEHEIGWYKVVFAVLAAIDVSLLAWFAKNYDSQNAVLLFACFMAILFVSAGIALINNNVFKCLKRLKEL